MKFRSPFLCEILHAIITIIIVFFKNFDIFHSSQPSFILKLIIQSSSNVFTDFSPFTS